MAQRTQTLGRSETNKAYCLWPESFLLFPSPPCPYTSITSLRPSCVFFSFILTFFVIFLLLLFQIQTHALYGSHMVFSHMFVYSKEHRRQH